MATIEFPRQGTAGVMTLKNGSSYNYGSDGVKDGYFYYYTGMGLREMFNPNPQTEEQKKLASELQKKSKEELKTSGHYAKIPTEDILIFA